MNYILDTNVVSELAAREPDPNVIKWMNNIDSESVFLSVLTIGEIKKGFQTRSAKKHWSSGLRRTYSCVSVDASCRSVSPFFSRGAN